MDDTTTLAANQLGRMRGMTLEYHRRFFGDIRMVLVLTVVLFVLGFWEVPAAFLLIPFVALYGAVQTAFDASYLIFARHYAARLEQLLNTRTGEKVHVAAEMEDVYLFPLDVTKVVTAAFGSRFSWFGFVTLFYTTLGVVGAAFGLALGWVAYLDDQGTGWQFAYLLTFAALTTVTLITGVWWFVGGEGERRLRTVLEGFASD